MAQRGVAAIIDINFHDVNQVDITISYAGFQHASEDITFHVYDIGPNILSSSALKAAVKSVLVEWYNGNPSGDYDDWNNLLDNFVFVGGVL